MLAPATAPVPTNRAYSAEEQALIAKLEATRHDMLAGWRMMVALRKTGEIATDFSNERRALRACLHLMRGEPLPELRDNPDLPIESIGARAPRPPGAKRRVHRRHPQSAATPAPTNRPPAPKPIPVQPIAPTTASTHDDVPPGTPPSAADPVEPIAAPTPPLAHTAPQQHAPILAAPAPLAEPDIASSPTASSPAPAHNLPPPPQSAVRTHAPHTTHAHAPSTPRPQPVSTGFSPRLQPALAHTPAQPTRTHARSPRPRDSHRRHRHTQSSLARPRIRAPAARPPTRDAPGPRRGRTRAPSVRRGRARTA